MYKYQAYLARIIGQRMVKCVLGVNPQGLAMSFRITGLAPEPFQHLFALSDAELAARGAVRRIADRKPGFRAGSA